MIVVVASSHDERARRIAAYWGPQCAAILTVEDLCSPGWFFSIPPAHQSTAVINGELIDSAQISGILTLRPRVFPQELCMIRSEDRSYVAAELTAFLLAWLASQSCSVLNRPVPPCLAGPNWRPEQWSYAAETLGIPVLTQPRHIAYDDEGATWSTEEEAIEIMTVGGQCFGSPDLALQALTRQLAKKAKVELLLVRFSEREHHFLSANPWPALNSPMILDAVYDRLTSFR